MTSERSQIEKSTNLKQSPIFLIVFGDSLSLPRPFDEEGIESFADTWTGQIQKSELVCGITNFSVGGYTSKDVYKLTLKLSPYLNSSKNLIIIFVGVVDSAPRAYPKRLNTLFAKVRALLNLLGLKWIPQRSKFLLRIWGRPYFTPKQYRSYLGKIPHLFPKARVVFISILEPGGKMIEILGNYNVIEYNLNLRSIDASNVYHLILQDAELHPDGHHLSKKGHLQISDLVTTFLEELNNS